MASEPTAATASPTTIERKPADIMVTESTSTAAPTSPTVIEHEREPTFTEFPVASKSDHELTDVGTLAKAKAVTKRKMVVKAVGDPHMTNLLGQRFDLAQSGTHVLAKVPKWADAGEVLLQVNAEVEKMSESCSDIYIQKINITGQWVEQTGMGVMRFAAKSVPKHRGWNTLGKVDVKVVRGKTRSEIHYLNIFTRHLGSTGMVVGGLLGEDDHPLAAKPSPNCV